MAEKNPTAHAGARQDSTPEQAAPISTDDLRKLLDAATPGPWSVRTLENFGWNVVHYRDGDKFDILRVAKTGDEGNAHLIALVPQLATEVLARRADLAAPSAPAEVEGLVLPEMYAACGRCEENGEYECVHRLHDLRHDGEMWSCEDCWNPDESDKWADAPEAATTLTALQAENERLSADLAAPSAPAEVEGLVERLRRYGKSATHPGVIADYSEELALMAATALTALQAEIERLRASRFDVVSERNALQARAEKAEGERDALMTAVDAEIKRSRRHLSAATLAAYAKLKGDL